mgnify:CR=1 FL=1
MNGIGQIKALYEYNEWANGHVLDAAAGLSEEELARDVGASFGSIQGNLLHVLAAQGYWLALWNGSNDFETPKAEAGRAIESIREQYAANHEGLRGFVVSLREGDLPRTVTYDRRGNFFERPLWQILLQVANHGVHHRAEMGMAFSALGKPIRQLDYVLFELERSQK